MCKLKSCIVLKDRIYMPDHDNHSQMLEELKIKDNSTAPNFVRVEISPENGDVFSPVDTWKMLVDQDYRPDWFFEEVEKPRVVAALKTWAEEHIFTDRHDLKLTGDQIVYLKNCTVEEMYDSSTVEVMRGNSTVEVMRGSSTVEAMCGSSTVKAMCDSSTVKAMYGNSTVEAMYGNSTVEVMRDSSTVEVMHDNSTVEAMCDSSTVEVMCDSSTSTISRHHRGNPCEAVTIAQDAILRDLRTSTLYCAKEMQIARLGGEVV